MDKELEATKDETSVLKWTREPELKNFLKMAKGLVKYVQAIGSWAGIKIGRRCEIFGIRGIFWLVRIGDTHL